MEYYCFLFPDNYYDFYFSPNASIRLSLIQSIIRFVNGILDSGQNGVKAVSLKLIATRFGFPLPLVEIRHAATHNKLPSLETTKHAALLVLQYINQNYFEQQKELLSDSKQKIAGHLANYKSQKEKLILLTNQNKSVPDTLKDSIENDIKAIKTICSAPEKVITDLLPLLFSDRFLIPEMYLFNIFSFFFFFFFSFSFQTYSFIYLLIKLKQYISF